MDALKGTATWPEVIVDRPLNIDEQQKARYERVIEYMARAAGVRIVLPDAVGDKDFGQADEVKNPVQIRDLTHLLECFKLSFNKIIPHHQVGTGGEGLMSIASIQIDEDDNLLIIDDEKTYVGKIYKNGTVEGLSQEIIDCLTPNHLQITESDVSDSRESSRRRMKCLFRKSQDYEIGYRAK